MNVVALAFAGLPATLVSSIYVVHWDATIMLPKLHVTLRSFSSSERLINEKYLRFAEHGLSFLFSVCEDASLGDILLAPAYPIEKATLRESLLCLTSGYETDDDVAKDRRFQGPYAIHKANTSFSQLI